MSNLSQPGAKGNVPGPARPAGARPRLAPVRRTRVSRRQLKQWLWGYLFVSPVVLGLLIFTLWPMLMSLYYSFTKYDLLSPPRWIGINNYLWLFSDRPDAKFLGSLWVTVKYSLISVPLNMLVSLLLALVLNQELRGVSFYRAVFYIPAMVPIVAAAILFSDLYNVKYGIINSALRAVGLPPSTWATRSDTALQALIIMNLWGVGAGTVIWLAGLKGVPRELYEAASIDGANLFQRIRSITIPLISPVIFFNLIMGIITALQSFANAYVLTSGGPENATMFSVLYVFNLAFKEFAMGRAAAVAWVLFALIGLLTLVVFKTSGWVYYDGEARQ